MDGRGSATRGRRATVEFGDLWAQDRHEQRTTAHDRVRRGRRTEGPTAEGNHDGVDRLHGDGRAGRPAPARAGCGAGRGGGLRPHRGQRPHQPLVARAGPFALHVVGPRCHRPGHRGHRAHDLRHLPDHALPPGGRGPEGRHDPALVRGPVHARARCGGEPQRARRGAGLAARRRPPRDAGRGDRHHPAAAGRRDRDPAGPPPGRGGGQALGRARRASAAGRGRLRGPFLRPGRRARRRHDRGRAAGRARRALRRRRRGGQAPDRPERPVLRRGRGIGPQASAGAVPLVPRGLAGDGRAARTRPLRRRRRRRTRRRTSPPGCRAGPTCRPTSTP